MNDVASSGANIQKMLLEVTSEALGAALLVCDRHDEIIFISRHILQFFPVPTHFLQAGTRLKDFLGAVYDCGLRTGTVPEASRRRSNREEWISDHISLHWRERFEMVERIGRHRWISINKRRLSNGYGIVAILDVSEQKKREEQLQNDLERVAVTEGILDNLTNPICVKDRNFTYVAVNKAFCALHGLAPEAFLGRSVWDVLEPELAEKFERSDRTVLETGEPFSLPEQMVRADGEDLWVVTRKFRIGSPGKYLIVTCMNDVTDIALWSADPADETKVTPHPTMRRYDTFEPAQNCYDPFRALDLQNIVGPGAIIVPPAEAVRILVHTADPATEARILPLLAGWGFEACAIRNLAEQGEFFALAGEAGLEIGFLLVDRQAPEARRAIDALKTLAASAALKRLSVLAFAPDADPAALKTEIDAALAAQTALCAEPGAGRTMIVDAALAVDCDMQAAPVLHQKIDVLVAEDNQINQFVFTQILEGLGLTFRIAANGEEALTLWEKHRPDLVLMDVAMPVMNGPEAAVAIRKVEDGNSTLGMDRGTDRTPIVAVMAQAIDLDLERCRTAGMDDHIMKPVSPDMIEEVYRRFVPGRAGRKALS